MQLTREQVREYASLKKSIKSGFLDDKSILDNWVPSLQDRKDRVNSEYEAWLMRHLPADQARTVRHGATYYDEFMTLGYDFIGSILWARGGEDIWLDTDLIKDLNRIIDELELIVSVQ